MTDFKPKPKERGNVILAEDWNSAMDEIVRVGGEIGRVGAHVELLDKSALKPIAGKLPGDLTIAGALSVTGNATIGTAGSVFFENKARQMINLWTTEYGIGIQGATQYFRTARNFAWYKGGSHNDGEIDAGGGTVQMVIKEGNVGIGTGSPSVPLEVNGAVKATSFQGDGSKLVGLDVVSKSGGTITGALTVTAIVTAAGFVGDGSKLTGIDKGPWTAKDGALVYGGGNVGIGLDKPSATLEVNGTIKAAKFVGDGSGLTGIVAPAAPETKWIDSPDGIQYKTGAKVTIGAPNSGTSLQIINKNQDPSGDSLVVGRLDGTHLRLGYQTGYAWIQSQTDKPLAINPLGGKVGIGTSDPQAVLDVAGGAIALRQAADPNSAGTLLDKLPNSSLVLGGPSGESIVFFWKDENGKKYQLSLKGEALTG